MKRNVTIERMLLGIVVILQLAIFMSMNWKKSTNDANVSEVTIESSGRDIEYLSQENDEFKKSPFSHSLHSFPFRRQRNSLFREMDAMMESAFRDMDRMTALMSRDAGWDQIIMSPTMDMREVETNYVISLCLPGVESSDIEVILDDRILTVQSTRRKSTDTGKEFSQFKRRIRLPGPVADGGSASLTNGILKVTIPRQTVASANASVCRKLF